MEEAESIPTKVRKHLHLDVITHPTEEITITDEDIQRVADLVKQYEGSVSNENQVRKIKTKPVHMEYEENFLPQQPKFRNG